MAGSKFFEKELRTRGALQQTISSCIELMDVFLRQSEVVVSSMVIAEKKTTCTVNNIVDRVASIIGIRNLKTISFQSTLPELGLDSRTTTEVRQTFESEFKIFLTIPGVRSLTFARYEEGVKMQLPLLYLISDYKKCKTKSIKLIRAIQILNGPETTIKKKICNYC